MLARIAVQMADLDCNILGLSVIPVPDGVLDEMVVRPARQVTKAQLIKAIEAEGCACIGITDAAVRELVDATVATLFAACRAVEDPARFAEVMREVLAADLVTIVPLAEANPGRTEGGHRAVVAIDGEHAVVARRRWAPFAQLELARAEALVGLLDRARTNLAEPKPVTCADGAMVVLRRGRPSDGSAVLALHERCSTESLFQRYQGAVSGMPRRWLHRLLLPPRGLSLLAVCGRDVVGLGQLILGETAEVSLLVEDAWQRNGVGTALMARLAVMAAAVGHRHLLATAWANPDALFRLARRAGLVPEQRAGERLVRISIPPELAPRIAGAFGRQH